MIGKKKSVIKVPAVVEETYVLKLGRAEFLGILGSVGNSCENDVIESIRTLGIKDNPSSHLKLWFDLKKLIKE